MRRTLVPALAGLALALSGCAPTQDGGDGGDRRDGGRPTGPSVAAGAPAGGHATLDTPITTLAGEPFDATTVAEQPVVLWFWAPWCTICRAEAPDVAELATELRAAGSPVTLLGVSGRGEVSAMHDFVSETGTQEITHLVDADGSLWRAFGVITQPAFALISADGEVEVVNGALGADGLRAAASRLAEG